MTKKEVAAVLFSLANGIAQTAEDLAKEAGEESQDKEETTPRTEEANPPESNKTSEPDTVQKEKKKEIHLEDVRAVLSEISRSGHTAEMKALLAKHGVKKLSDVPSEDYEQLLAEAEEVKNA